MKKTSGYGRRSVEDIFKKNAAVKLDLGCGENKQPGCIGIDFRKLPGIDIVQDLNSYPWRAIPDECADTVFSSHLIEHINPAPSDPRLAGLIDLLKIKRIITDKEISTFVGDYRFLSGFLRFTDEVWRVLRVGGQFISTFPYAGSSGYWMDPTHINPVSHVTLAYLDPLAKDSAGNFYNLYTIYRPKPWKVVKCFYDINGLIEVALEKRAIDPSYKTLSL